jgi:predicted glycosyltransferase involved in capsule biosynthesis
MKSTTFLKRLKEFLARVIDVLTGYHPKISIIIPYSSKDKRRDENFRWLLKYWEENLPDAEIIIGKHRGKVFCKSAAMNEAVRRSRGRVLAFIDADAYLPARRVEHCANRILKELHRGHNLWFIPYRKLYRLNRNVTKQIVRANPKTTDFVLPCPLPKHFVDTTGQNKHYGYRFCAMAFIIPRQAYDYIGGFDERFEGWGGEDISLMKTLDTVWGKHKTTKGCIYHLWHPFVGAYESRKWEGQERANANDGLSYRYVIADRNPSLMWELITEEKRKQD